MSEYQLANAVHCIILANVSTLVLSNSSSVFSKFSHENFSHCFYAESCINKTYCIPDNSGRHCDLCEGYQDADTTILMNKNIANVSQTVCAPCFFPQHCYNMTSCLTGTTGRNCERCGGTAGEEKDHHLVGNFCSKCPIFPWSLTGFLIFGVMIGLTLFYNSFIRSIYTKFKIMMDFIQFILLSFHIKVHWSEALVFVGEISKLGTFNTDMFSLDCTLSGSIYHHYLEWFTTILIPTTALILGICLNFQKKTITQELGLDSVKLEASQKGSRIGHVVYFILISYYMPLCIAAAHSFSCTEYFGKALASQDTVLNTCFLYDLSVDCEDFMFQTLQFILAIFTLMFLVPFPLGLLFFTLREHKWDLLEKDSLKYGYIYDSYNNNFCFWDVLILLRKIISIIVTDTLLTDPFVQAYSLLVISLIYVLALIATRPYKNCHWVRIHPLVNNNFVLEILSTLSVIMVQSSALHNARTGHRGTLDLVCYGLIVAFAVSWIISMVFVKLEVSTGEQHPTVDQTFTELSEQTGSGRSSDARSPKKKSSPVTEHTKDRSLKSDSRSLKPTTSDTKSFTSSFKRSFKEERKPKDEETTSGTESTHRYKTIHI